MKYTVSVPFLDVDKSISADIMKTWQNIYKSAIYIEKHGTTPDALYVHSITDNVALESASQI